MLFPLLLITTEDNSCRDENWNITLSRPGWANCSLGSYLKGLWRANDAEISKSSRDGIDNIKQGRCCITPHEYQDQAAVCHTVNWKSLLSRLVNLYWTLEKLRKSENLQTMASTVETNKRWSNSGEEFDRRACKAWHVRRDTPRPPCVANAQAKNNRQPIAEPLMDFCLWLEEVEPVFK